jgi:hypothetical protein
MVNIKPHFLGANMNGLTAINHTHAKLPQAYEAAKAALANCASIDECKDWGDKAAALASYAKQADDDTLRKHAERIQARAIRRCGELLKQIEPASKHNAQKTKGGQPPFVSRTDAARQAGLSEHQQKQAVRVASVPQEQFDNQVESDEPPTVTKLAEQGKKPRQLIDLKGRDPKDFNKAMHFKGMLQDYSRDLAAWNIHDLIPRLIDADRAAIRKIISEIDAVHDMIMTRI